MIENTNQEKALVKTDVSKSAFLNVNNVRKTKSKNNGLCYLSTNRHSIQFYTHEKMIVGIYINNSEYVEEKFWNRKIDILIDAVYNGFHYRLGIEKYKSKKSLVICCNNFVKYILADSNDAVC
jgi:hypothetical protein